MVGGGLEPSADSDGTRRPKAARTLGERQRFVVVGEMEGRAGVAVRPPVGSAETPRVKRASNPQKLVPEPGFEPGPPYGERILSHINIFIINN
jgi:hypothetical protein